MVLTPTPNDLRLLGADYPDLETLERDLPIFKLVDEGAVVVIVARETDRTVIENKLLPLCGPRVSGVLRVLLVRRPASPDITDAEVIIIAHRRDVQPCMPENAWFDDAGPFDPLAVAEALCPGAARKGHVFARAPTEGWRCLIGEKSLFEMPEAA